MAYIFSIFLECQCSQKTISVYDEMAYDMRYLRVRVTCRPELPAEERTQGGLMLL